MARSRELHYAQSSPFLFFDTAYDVKESNIIGITMMPPLSFVFKNFLKKTAKNDFYLKTMKTHPKIATDSFENEP